MQVNLNLALIPALIATTFGVCVGLFLYVKIVKKKYLSDWQYSTHGKIRYWCSVCSILIIAKAISEVLHEFLFTSFNNTQLKNGIFYEISLWLIGILFLIWLLGIFFPLLVSNNKIRKKVENYLTNDELLISAVNKEMDSQFKIGQQYWIGDGRIKDATIAYAWLRIAKENGSQAAKFFLENYVYKNISQYDVDNHYKLYEELKRAIEISDLNLCELLINKSLDERSNGESAASNIQIKAKKINLETINSLSSFDILVSLIGVVLISIILFYKEENKKPATQVKAIEEIKTEIKTNFYENDMEFILENCKVENMVDEEFAAKKFFTSIGNRTSILALTNKSINYEKCVLIGKNYICENNSEEDASKVTYDTFYQILSYQKLINSNENHITKETLIQCDAASNSK